ncbi:MAG: ATP-binding protein, partial [Bacteroidota bacterium]|nr:ATP-binding protein [Bacteroidota bacterium]
MGRTDKYFSIKKIFFSKSLILLWLLIFLLPQISISQPYPYKFNYLTVDEGLSHTDANDIAQDKQGFIWVATFFGLDRYDGYSVKKYYNKNVPLDNASRNRIACIYPDSNGNIWLGTEAGLQCFDARHEKYIDFTDATLTIQPRFQKLFKPAGKYLYGLAENRLYKYLIKDYTIKKEALTFPEGILFSDFSPSPDGELYLSGDKGIWRLGDNDEFKKAYVSGLSDQHLSMIYFDHQNNLLVAANNKVFKLENKNAQPDATQFLTIRTEYTDAADAQIRSVCETNKGEYWVNTGTAVLRLDNSLNLIQDIKKESSLHGLNSNSLTKTFIDRSECLWICTFGGGVNYCDLNQKLFYTLQHNPEMPNSLSGNHIRSVLEDGKNLWIGTTANGLNLYNLDTHNFTYYNIYNSKVRLKNDAISALTLDDDKNLWIGSSAGIEILKPSGTELLKPAGYDKFPAYAIEAVVKDCYGNIWFGNHTNQFGVIWKDKSNYYHVRYYGEGYFILPDKTRPQLFISSTHGLKRIIIDGQGNILKSFVYHATSNPNSLSSDYIYPLCRQNDSTYWIGTIGGGLDRLLLHPGKNAYSIKSYSENYGVFNDVESLEISNDGNIWMGGNGLECLNPATGKLTRYDKNDGLQGNSFKVGSSFKGADGRLYFGGINGLNYFYPNEIMPNTIAARPVLTDILINNQQQDLTSADPVKNSIKSVVNFCNRLTLNYLQNNFVITFSSMHYANPFKCKYRYKLIGYDKDWVYTDGRNPSAAYSNLDYNNYKFIVEATNNDGLWSTARAQAEITLTPPWWKSTTAKIIYVLLIISGLLGVYIYQARWYRLKRELEVQKINEEKREEMHRHREELYQQQLVFFTNISHEFRTPLTLILGPMENLISQNNNALLDNSYRLIHKNAKRLTNLISELMNFKKVADSVIKLQVKELPVKQFCKDLALEFQNLATSKEINFKMIDHTEKDANTPLTGFFDEQILEKILFNLLSNSFKYTNIHGQVNFEVFFDFDKFVPSFVTGFSLLNEDYRAEKYIYFRIADSGIGISGDSIKRIFERYYRISKNHLGSGVGLALVKSLTQLHKGDIYVYSERHKGTEIIVGIPWGEDNYQDNEKAKNATSQGCQLEEIDNSTLLLLDNDNIENGNNIETGVSKLPRHILLVEDNDELRAFLKQIFEKYYHVYEAEDG